MTSYDEDDIPEAVGEPGGRTAQTYLTRVRLLDGTGFTVRVSQRDKIQWDLVAPRKKWGKAQDVPFLAQAFVTWAAAKRQELTDLKFEDFRDALDEIEEDEPDASDLVHPTKRGPGPAPS